jgi:hypothetical protein
MRVPPAVIDFSTVAMNDFSGGYTNITTLTFYRGSNNTAILSATTANAYLVANRTFVLTTQTSVANGYVGFSAEL